MIKEIFRRLCLLMMACELTRVSPAPDEDVEAPNSGVSSRVCNAMKPLCLVLVFGAKSVVAVLASVLVSDIVSLSLRLGEAMFSLMTGELNVEDD
jgi:hypothetical protein